MFCTKCGTQLYENARFCHKCGNEMIPYNTVGQNVYLEQEKAEDTEEEYLTKEELYYHSNFRNYRIELLVVGIILAIIGILGAEIFSLQNEKGQALIFFGVFLALETCLCCAKYKCNIIFF